MKYYYDYDEYFDNFTDAVEGKTYRFKCELYGEDELKYRLNYGSADELDDKLEDEDGRRWFVFKGREYINPMYYKEIEDFANYREAMEMFKNEFWDEVERCRDEYRGDWPW